MHSREREALPQTGAFSSRTGASPVVLIRDPKQPEAMALSPGIEREVAFQGHFRQALQEGLGPILPGKQRLMLRTKSARDLPVLEAQGLWCQNPKGPCGRAQLLIFIVPMQTSMAGWRRWNPARVAGLQEDRTLIPRDSGPWLRIDLRV